MNEQAPAVFTGHLVGPPRREFADHCAQLPDPGAGTGEAALLAEARALGEALLLEMEEKG